MKKLLAVLLVLCLFVGMMPMAFAAGLVEETQSPSLTPTADDTIDTQEELETAIKSSDAVTLGGDINLTETLTINRNVTISGSYALRGDATISVDGATVTFSGCTVDRAVNIELTNGANASGLAGYVIATVHEQSATKIVYTDDYTKYGVASVPSTREVFQSVQDALNAKVGQVWLNAPTNENVIVPAGGSLYLNSTLNGTLTIEKGGEVGGNLGWVTGEITDKNDEENPPVDPEPDTYKVTFSCTPSQLTLYDNNNSGAEVIKDNCRLPNGTYTYTAKADGYFDKIVEFTVKDADLVVPIRLTPKPVNHVTVHDEAHGHIYTGRQSLNPTVGTPFWLWVEPDSGYILTDITVTKLSGGEVKVYHERDNLFYFYMPDGYVFVDATFKALPDEYRVYIANTEHGTVSVDTRYAEEGEWVYITVNPNAGYRLSDLTVTRPSGNTVKVEHVRGNVFRFAMPGVRVTVDAEFVRTTMPFTDVSRGQWFYDAVSFVYWRDLMDGVTSTQFAPDATTTRAMVVQILYRMAGSPTVRGSSPFYDVSNGAWYADAVIWAEANDIVNGMTTTTFAPNTAVTREQLATMLYRYAQYRHYNTSAGENTNILSYYDANRISEYAFSALQWACGEGIMDGTGTGYLSPQGQATRAQLAAMLMRFCMEYRI